MTAQEVFSALQGMDARVVRGGEQGLPPPTVGYTLSMEKEGYGCALHIRAYMREQCDALAENALNRLKGLGFYLEGRAEGSEKDTGVFTLRLSLRRGSGAAIRAGNATVNGVRKCLLQRQRPHPAVALDGTVRPLMEEISLVLHLQRLSEDVGQNNLFTQGVRLEVEGEVYRAYLVSDMLEGQRREQRYILLPWTQ